MLEKKIEGKLFSFDDDELCLVDCSCLKKKIEGKLLSFDDDELCLVDCSFCRFQA